MSEREFDEDELAELYESHPDSMDPEDLLSMVLVNRKRMVKTSIELQDEDGDEVPLRDIIQELLHYIKDQMEDGEENQFASQIMPLMTEAVISGLGRMIGTQATAFHLAQEQTRHAFIQMMCIGLLLLKFIQKKGLKICTFEQSVTQEEIEEIDRKSKANSVATLASMSGHDPIAVLQELKDRGVITEDDLKDLINGDRSDVDPEKQN